MEKILINGNNKETVLPEIIVAAGNYTPQLEQDYFNSRAEWARFAALNASKRKTAATQTLINGKADNNCIINATDDYHHPVAGNITFARNPQTFGFIELTSLDKIKPGDMVQEWLTSMGGNDDNIAKYNSRDLVNKKCLGVFPQYRPAHMMIFDSKNNKGMPLFNYANGSGDYRIRSGFEFDPNLVGKDYALPISEFNDKNYKAYRFIGTDQDRDLWRKELKAMLDKNNK